jgi:hypothetical protein
MFKKLFFVFLIVSSLFIFSCSETELPSNTFLVTRNVTRNYINTTFQQLYRTSLAIECDISIEGSIYYDSTLNEPCFCNGISWVQFDGGGLC